MENTQLLIVDPQNDFCDIPTELLPRTADIECTPALPVPGSHQDMLRLSNFIRTNAQLIQGITVTLDSHPFVAIERTTFWTDHQGQEIAPFTVVTLDDVEQGRYRPANHLQLVLERLRVMDQHRVMVWPVHCVTGSWGHNIHADVAQALNEWDRQSCEPVHKTLKGEYPWSEHFGAFVADTPIQSVPSTLFNETLAQRLTHGVDTLLVAGQASSHCVAASIDQLQQYMRDKGLGTQVVLLTDCMSPVSGFEQAQEQFFVRAAANQALCLTSEQAREHLNRLCHF